jgi:hypothetical protein
MLTEILLRFSQGIKPTLNIDLRLVAHTVTELLKSSLASSLRLKSRSQWPRSLRRRS